MTPEKFVKMATAQFGFPMHVRVHAYNAGVQQPDTFIAVHIYTAMPHVGRSGMELVEKVVLRDETSRAKALDAAWAAIAGKRLGSVERHSCITGQPVGSPRIV